MADLKDDVALRTSMRLRLQQNPNFFGNLKDLDLKGLPEPVFVKVGDTTYEELTCLGYNPDTDILTAIVRIKQSAGYMGGPCAPGSREYVRFYLDYGDGTWVDHGSASFEIHDLGFTDPLCYAVSVKIKPKRKRCCGDKPVLPTVRAILSWNVAPPANQPNWSPVWGNRLQRDIQIEPRSPWLCLILDKIDIEGIQKINPDLLAKLNGLIEDAGPAPKPIAPLSHQIGKEDRGDTAHMARLVYPMLASMAANPEAPADLSALKSWKQIEIDIDKIGDIIFAPNFNTAYEELHCVGLDRDLSLLHGIVQVKRPNGYSGGLCTQGSREYIAFYLDFGSGWEYQGTTFVDVHDVGVPRGGLWYQASLPVNLDKHRQEWCRTGRARIRGILSWAVPPAPNDANHVPVWGDREDCWIEVRPWPKGVIPGQTTPVLEAIGRMAVAQIDGAGFANGASVGGTFSATDAPFGGVITMSGIIANPSNLSLQYRVMVKAPSDAVAKAQTKTFGISVTTVIGSTVTFSSQSQIAAGDWFTYVPQNGPAVFRSVAESLLYVFQATEQGLHTVYLQVREAGTSVILATSGVEAFFVDNSAPVADVTITSGGGNCSKFKVGEVLVGTYSMSDTHSGGLSLSVTPAAAAAGGLLAITSVVPAAPLPPLLPGPSASNSLSYPLRLTTTGASGQWELDTSAMKPCGYNIRIVANDRTIVNSSGVSWQAYDDEGFCLELP
ncbi:MAG: hypothetical protein LCH69_16525 [Proteobacteria bacterium]|nr:hypothetical protein [Pseudomonadota bacterium]